MATRDEAILWYYAHPNEVKGYQLETFLARVHSSTDDKYYSPSTFVASGSSESKSSKSIPEWAIYGGAGVGIVILAKMLKVI
jgi:hypothetical protein